MGLEIWAEVLAGDDDSIDNLFDPYVFGLCIPEDLTDVVNQFLPISFFSNKDRTYCL